MSHKFLVIAVHIYVWAANYILFIFISRAAWNLKFVFRDLSGNELQSLPGEAFNGLAKLSKL